MHFMIAFFVIVGLIGAVMFLTDENLNLFGSGEAASIVKKFKQEEEAFAQFCKEQEVAIMHKRLTPFRLQEL